MGAILAKFRKEKTTAVVLEGLEEEIQQLEKYTLNTQEQKKKFVGSFLAIAIGVYAIAFIVFYFVYFPPTLKEQLIYSVPLMLFPVVIVMLRRLFTWYFQRKLNKNSNKLSALRAEKKKILERVMDKETYKVAVSLLARYGEKNNGHKSLYAMTPRVSSTGTFGATPRLTVSQAASTLPMPGTGSPLRSSILNTPMGSSSSLAAQRALSGYRGSPMSNTASPTTGRQLALSPQQRSGQELRLRTPFPILNQQSKTVFERIVDVLIGDGPQDRFAMICKECHGHNGMALKEDFEYMTFRCAFCNALNPSRKSRPIAPRLPEQQHAIAARQSSDSSSSTDHDSDDDNETRKGLKFSATPVLLEEDVNTNVPRDSDGGEDDGSDGFRHDDGDVDRDSMTEHGVGDDTETLPLKENRELHSDEMSRLQECFNKMYASLDEEIARESAYSAEGEGSNGGGDGSDGNEVKKTK